MKTTAILLTTLLLAHLPFAKAQYTWVTNSGSITIIAYTGSDSVVTIPDQINGFPVATIGPGAFEHQLNLEEVTMPHSVINLKDDAFLYCGNLKKVTLSTNLRNIGQQAFLSCASLPNILIPASVTNIGSQAFSTCISLTNITVDPLNSTYASKDGVLLDKSLTTLIQSPPGIAGTFVVPTGVTTIAAEAFAVCSQLTAIEIPSTVINIGASAFASCSGLESVMIPNSVSFIGDGAFGGCTRLRYIALPSGITRIGSFVFNDTALVHIDIPNSVTSIGDSAFAGCLGLTNLTIPGSVTRIERNAFYQSYNLRGMYFLGNAPSLGSDVFFPDFSLTIYYVPGTSGWSLKYGGRATSPWVLPAPVILMSDPFFGIQTNGFGFTISWASNVPVVVEASPNLAAWSSISTNTLVSGTAYFRDPHWTNYLSRFYRVRSQ